MTWLSKNRLLQMAVALFILTVSANAEVPQVINYQGLLTDSSDNRLDTTVQMSFTIFDGGGASKWTETHPSVVVSDGLFNVLLGTINPIPDSTFNLPDRFLGIKVGDDGELTPRTRLTSVPYAMRSAQADTADYAAEAPILVITEEKTASLTTGAIGPDTGAFEILFDNTFTRPPSVFAVVTLRSDGGGYTKGSTLAAEFTVSSEGFAGFIYTFRGGAPVAGFSVDINYSAQQIGP